jgi:dihydroorotate dehydrogenase (NAD+) catalytic subunit
MFAHSATATSEAVAAVGSEHQRWVKLSPNTSELIEIAQAAVAAGADALTLTNTVLGMAIDIERREVKLGGRGGGVSGPGIRPVSLRAVYECAAALPATPIIGAGGVSKGVDALEFLMAGASGVQVGTATLAEPRAPWRIMREMQTWMRRHGVNTIAELIGAAHG